MIEIKPTTLKQANAYVEAVHRHHGRVVGHKWSLAAFKDGRLCGRRNRWGDRPAAGWMTGTLSR